MENSRIVQLFENVIESRKKLCIDYDSQIKEIEDKKARRVKKQNKLSQSVIFYIIIVQQNESSL